MRGGDVKSEALFSYVSCEARVPLDHPLRPIRKIVDEALGALSAEFEKLYAKFGRPSIAPEKLLRALLLQAFYSVRSERQLMEQLDYNLLFRWFVGLSLDAVVWDVTVFTKNRERLIAGDIAGRFMAAVLNQERVKTLLSDDHFSVDGTLIEAWASPKSFRPKDGSGEPPVAGRNGERDFHGEKRRNETHTSATDPDARFYRKGPGQLAKLAYLGHVLMENRHALVVDTRLTLATGTAEREAGHCQVEAFEPEYRSEDCRHAAVVALRHCAAASDRKIRSVDRETRWRWRLKVLWTAACTLRKRCADAADLKRCILRSRRRTT